MAFVPPLELEQGSVSRYLAVVLTAKEARRINTLPREFRKEYGTKKVTTIALDRLAKGKIKYATKKKKKKL